MVKNFRLAGALFLLVFLFLFVNCAPDTGRKVVAEWHGPHDRDCQVFSAVLEKTPIDGFCKLALGEVESLTLAEWRHMIPGSDRGKEAVPQYQTDSTFAVNAIPYTVSFQQSDGRWLAFQNCWVLPGTNDQDIVSFVGLFIPARFGGQVGEYVLVDKRLVTHLTVQRATIPALATTETSTSTRGGMQP